MFKFLKDKIKGAVDKFSKEVDEEAETLVEEETIEEKAPKKSPKKKEKADSEKKKDEKKPAKKKPSKKKAPAEKKPKTEKKEAKKEEEAPEKKQEEPEVKVDDDIVAEADEHLRQEGEFPEQEEPPEKKGFLSRFKGKFTKEEAPEGEPEEAAEEESPEEGPEEEPEEEPEEKGVFRKIKESVTKKVLSEDKFEELFWDIELALLENNVAFEVIEKIKQDLHDQLVDKKIDRSSIQSVVLTTLQESLEGLFKEPEDLLAKAKAGKPYTIMFVGVNGSGKTTSIAKLAHYFKNNKLTPVIAAGDTFRAAAIQQLEEHADKLDVKLIKHDYGSDPAAVAFDAVKYAEAGNADVVLIDTAGRLHSNVNLMDELKKIGRVVEPDLTLFVGEAVTGNDCVEQARQFDEAVGIDGIILTKADVDEKGGAFVSVSHVTGKPIHFVGMGQEYDDLKPFKKSLVLEHLGLE